MLKRKEYNNLMINRIRNPHQAEILFLQEPQTIADYNPEIMKSSQSLSHKTYKIQFAYTTFMNGEPSEVAIGILNDTMKDYPELAPEIRERYPHIEFTGDMPLFDSGN